MYLVLLFYYYMYPVYTIHFSTQVGFVLLWKYRLLAQKVAKTFRPKPLFLNAKPKVEAINLTLIFCFLYIIAYAAQEKALRRF